MSKSNKSKNKKSLSEQKCLNKKSKPFKNNI